MDDLTKKLQATVDWLRGEYSGIRTGQAAPGFLDNIKVDNYGVKVPINQVGSVGIENARTLRVAPWDTDSISAIERAIIDADLGVGVVTDSSGLRITFPELTGERREQLLKLAKQKLEEARVRVRNGRDEVMKSIDSRIKAKETGEDEGRRERDNVQKHIDEANKKLETLFVEKEKEISQ
ncbi:ribosome recycling factor [Candidatus Kaiserbacteria bacterium RIFCSPHIGHO2_01_FULL_46_22]|uniref:Ribosome recycling factor n=1 Tax=Candidatus Kaiserbacteria bacterium RIFCSPHIGHO2_01_FULL_46_22 TaxID=1798475 RepID=A0A1F6BYB6_9BACT|nr:MAG: ribosome recycling factor [Candidatus Kaiserbacteria bacterium RIFCSPHIGHO2_01_FULL_46_22]